MDKASYQRPSGPISELLDTGLLHQFRAGKHPVTHFRNRDVTVSPANEEPGNGLPRQETMTVDVALSDMPNSPLQYSTLDVGCSTTMSVSCRRCRRIKKKCDRSLSGCLACKRAGVLCDFPKSTSPYIVELNSRIDWLSALVDSLLPQNITVKSIRTGSDLLSSFGTQTSPTSVSETPAGSEPGDVAVHGDCTPLDSSQADPVVELSLSCLRELPPGLTHMNLIQTYFDQVHRSLPFLDHGEIFTILDSVALDRDTLGITPDSVKLYLVMANGCAELHRARRVTYDVFARFQVPYDEVVQLCFGDFSTNKYSNEPVQILLLLAFHSNHNNSGWKPRTVTNLLGQYITAMKFNEAITPDSGLSPTEIETRYRIFWCAFCIDRHLSVSLGVPFTINVDINIPLPSATIEEFAASRQAHHLTTLQLTRQAVALREIEGEIFTQIHLQAAHPGREREQLRLQIENWYTHGCLLVRMDTNDTPIHNTISWLNFSHNRLLALLYRPSSFNSTLGLSELVQVHLATRKLVRSSWAHFQNGCFALCHSSLYLLLVICRTMLHCYSHREVSCLVELDEAVMECVAILDSYDASWKAAHRCKLILRRFAKLVQTEQGEEVFGPQPTTTDTLDSIINASKSLMLDVMGSSSTYSFPSEKSVARR